MGELKSPVLHSLTKKIFVKQTLARKIFQLFVATIALGLFVCLLSFFFENQNKHKKFVLFISCNYLYLFDSFLIRY